MASGTKEIHFEEHVVDHLTGREYRAFSTEAYDKRLCLLPSEVIDFLKESQPGAYRQLLQQYGERTDEKILENIAINLSRHGALEIFRTKVSDRGQSLKLYYPRPRNNKNPEHWALYGKNRFAVVRQLKYSERNENSIDLVLFLNGIPVLTAELKNALTGQYLGDAVRQYQHDRDPKESLLTYKRCLVHFAVSTEKVAMTTRLAGGKTFFLPFNRDLENPANPDGFATAYLWEEIWERDSILDLIQNFISEQTDTEKFFDEKSRRIREARKKKTLFPRFHQLRVVRRLLEAIEADGVGNNYLIQHSAGSGKSNSISWLAHSLANFYRNPGDENRLYDCIIVVTDRKVLDRQLQDNIRQMEQVTGVVEAIDDKKTSADLKKAIEGGKTIIISTLQKFPVISETIGHFRDRNYAVIIDEAHSSQTGESARHLRKALSLEEAASEDVEERTTVDVILEEIQRKGKQPNISFFAFTATPKNKTLELFGTKGDGQLRPFDEYSMRQAIEEGFILDVLQNYMSFKRYFRLAKRPEIRDKEYETRKTIRLLNSYVDLQDHAIDLKSRIMLEHFMTKTQYQIQGKARAMLITRSRLHAVRYKRKFDELMREMKLPYSPLVAFSGTVYDQQTDEEYTETKMNNLGGRVSIPDALKTPQFRILIVANKFQTGFDEPLLHTMFVDKKLGGVSTVQTLSRLNRTAKGKDSAMILDFVNDPESILADFQEYYETSFIAEENQTDPNSLYELERTLAQHYVYNQQDLDAFGAIFFSKKGNMEKLQPILYTCVSKFQGLEEEAQDEFRTASNDFVRLYRFLSQIITFSDVQLEKLYVFLTALRKKLPKKKNEMPTEVLNEIELTSYKVQYQYTTSLAMEPGESEKYGLTPGGKGRSSEEIYDLLTNIIQVLNDTYGLDLNEEDRREFENIKEQINTNEELMAFFNPHNSRDNIRDKFFNELDNALLQFINTKLELYNKLTEEKTNETLKQMWFNHLYDERVRGMERL